LKTFLALTHQKTIFDIKIFTDSDSIYKESDRMNATPNGHKYYLGFEDRDIWKPEDSGQLKMFQNPLISTDLHM
jgi:hypothetical protein